MDTKKVVINTCYGGFGLSTKAYEKLMELGIPLREYVEQKRDPITNRFLPEPANDGEVIFKSLSTKANDYWDCWTQDNREHPLLVQVVEELGSEVDGDHSQLKIVEIPADVEYTIAEYDGIESIHEVHRSWY